MKYKWFKDTERELSDSGIPYQGIKIGAIETGGIVHGIDPEGNPIETPETRQGIELEFVEEPTQGQLARLDTLFGQAKREGVPPKSMHIAALTAVNTSTKKGTVVRKWMGENYTYTGCYVSLQALEAYQAGKIKLFNNAFGINAPENADSFVLVYFVSENPFDTAIEIPVIVDKLVR